jgi:hypothetical protein
MGDPLLAVLMMCCERHKDLPDSIAFYGPDKTEAQ